MTSKMFNDELSKLCTRALQEGVAKGQCEAYQLVGIMEQIKFQMLLQVEQAKQIAVAQAMAQGLSVPPGFKR